MDQVRLPGKASLPLVDLGAKDVGFPDQVKVGGRIIGGNLVEDVV